jgi:hypothetical protein
MSFGLLFFGILISVIAMLVTLIMSIISLATGKQRNGIIFGVGFIMSLVLAVLCIVETAKRGADKMKNGISWIKEMEEKNKSRGYSSGSEENYYGYIPEGNKDTVKAEFYYSSSDSGNQYYIPLVYPYRFATDDSLLGSGWLENFQTQKTDESVSRVKGITSFAFNDKLLLAKRNENQHNLYVLFDFKTGESNVFDSETKMEIEAMRRGFYKSMNKETFSSHYWNYAEEGD